MAEAILQRAFAGGELAPSLAMRADLARYQIGLRRCRNFMVQRFGGVANRPGTRFVGECKTADANVKLLRYVSEEPDQSVLIEAGESYFRFFRAGAAVEVDAADVDAWSGATAYVVGDLVELSSVIYYCILAHTNHTPANATYWYALPAGSGAGLSIYEIPHPFTADGLFQWTQSGRVITLTHPDAQPRELIFEALTRWVLRLVTTASQAAAPANPFFLLAGSGSETWKFKITAAAPETFEEGPPSAAVGASSISPASQAEPHLYRWEIVTVGGVRCPEYYIYVDPFGNDAFGFVGTMADDGVSATLIFRNQGASPDFAIGPPIGQTLFATSDDYPRTAGSYQQRRFFAGTRNVPDAVWASRVGFASNFNISSPLQDDDSIKFKIAGSQNQPVRWLVPLKTLLIMTASGEWTMQGAGGILSPASIQVDQEGYAGASADLRPVVVGNSVVFVQARDVGLRSLRFDQQVEGFAGKDLTLFAGHLFDGFTLRAIDFALIPHSIVWCVRSDGTLLGLTLIEEQEVLAWHRHDTAGAFEDVCVVPEPGNDAVYVVVSRTVDGSTVRYIEQLEQRIILDWDDDAFFVDSGLTYDGSPADEISGLDHLEGEEVDVVADGEYAGRFTVASGAITLEAEASVVHVGLPIVFDLEALDLDVNGTSVRDKRKIVKGVTLHVETSARTFKVGTSLTKLKPMVADTSQENTCDVVPGFTGRVDLSVSGQFDDKGRFFLRLTEPLPLTILGWVPQVDIA